MKPNKIRTALSAAAACSLFALASFANAEVTAPVGYVKLTFNSESDTPFSLPMNRPKAYSGQVVSISGNVITISDTDFTANEFVYLDGTQNENYYVLFTTGALEGRSFDVTANGANTVTIDPDYNEDNSSNETDIATQINDALATDNFEIRPHWTLNTLFPDGENFPSSSNNNLPAGRLMYRTDDPNNPTDVGVNIALSESYFFFDNGTASLKGWYPSGVFTKVPDEILRRDIMYVYRNSSSTTHSLNLVGDVPMTDSPDEVKILSDTIRQDNYMTLTFPIDTSLAESGILNMPGFAKSTGSTSLPNGDIVQVYAHPSVGINPAPVAQYIYFDATGTANDAWYLVGNINPGESVDDLKIFRAGAGYVIRKAEAFAGSEILNATLPYDPLTE